MGSNVIVTIIVIVYLLFMLWIGWYSSTKISTKMCIRDRCRTEGYRDRWPEYPGRLRRYSCRPHQ